jgi:arylsulfatase A-like enzyme
MRGIRVSSRQRLFRMLVTGLVMPWLGCGEPVPNRPNVVLILADDLGWRDTGVYGSDFYQTPNIDALALQGLRFTQAYSSSPLCSPTRASIVTGYNPAYLRFTQAEAHGDEVVEYPAEMPATAAADRAVVPAPSATRLALEHETLGRHLKDVGYRTGFFGKWHLGDGAWSPDRRGYDAVMPGGSEWGVERYYAPYHLPGFDEGPDGEHLDQRLAKEAVAFVRRGLAEQPDQPFFVSFWPFSVHYPFQAKTSLVQKYQRSKNPDQVQKNAVMAAMIEELDTALGILFDGLKDAGAWRDTVVIFTSDNGGVDWMGHRPNAPMATDNSPLRGGKAQIYEGGVRVPLIMSWPARSQQRRISRQLVSSEDLFATILHIAGIDRDEPRIHHGESLYPLLIGESAASSRDAVVIHYPNYVSRLDGSPASSIRVGRWKLIHNYATAGVGARNNKHELYDLEADVGEMNNVARAHPEVVQAMSAQLDAALKQMNALVPIPNPSFRAPEAGAGGVRR